MSRTRRTHLRGCMGNRYFSLAMGWIKPWEVHRDGPSNLGPSTAFKKQYRRRARRSWKRIDGAELRPIVKRTVLWDWW